MLYRSAPHAGGQQAVTGLGILVLPSPTVGRISVGRMVHTEDVAYGVVIITFGIVAPGHGIVGVVFLSIGTVMPIVVVIMRHLACMFTAFGLDEAVKGIVGVAIVNIYLKVVEEDRGLGVIYNLGDVSAGIVSIVL